MIIGIDLGGTNARAGLVKDGIVIATRQFELTDKDSAEQTLTDLFSTVEPLMQDEVTGIGIGVPSVVDTARGIVYDVVNIPSWKKILLKDILEERFSKPVYVNNDVNCFALGEQRFGHASAYASFVAVSIGTGMGTAIVIDHKLYQGVECGAGEIGYIPYLDKNLEFYASGMYFGQYGTTAKACYMAALAGEARALELWREYGAHLGEVIKIILYTYSPEAIVIGGGISNAFPFFEAAMQKKMEDFIFSNALRQLKIHRSTVENIALLGAAALVSRQEPVSAF